MSIDEDDYPLNCIDSIGDGFSGWFAITNPRKCNDFCFWNLENEGSSNSNYGGGRRYTALNTANPHQTTIIFDTDNFSQAIAHWTCIYDSANDETLISQATGQKWTETWHFYLDNTTLKGAGSLQNRSVNSDVPFPFLRCHKGAGEKLRTYSLDAIQSPLFWQSWIIFSTLIIGIQITTVYVQYKRRKLRRYDRLNPSFLEADVSRVDDLELVENTDSGRNHRLMSSQLARSESMGSGANLTHTDSLVGQYLPFNTFGFIGSTFTPYLKQRTMRYVWLFSILILNGLLIVTISFSSLSLMETKYHVQLSEAMEKFTPECTNPHLVCEKGNHQIDKSSEFINRTKPFSYIIASDAQLYWFNGEFAEMGEKNTPPFCTENDSCGHCTAKHGYSTNLRMKRAWETLMTEDKNQTNDPAPTTLIMNGDLTAYFHPYQKDAYETIYSGIEGLKYYFPGLGNHDIEHIEGAMFGGDEWIGPSNCNVEHAIGYFKSGFCGGIPHFLPERITRYDPESLAYSWEEGRFHFIMLHYYPSFEIAATSLRSSMTWLERDLQLASDAGLSSILFVHAAEGLNAALEGVILDRNVKAIFAGHTHRCLHRRCDGIYPLNEDQVGKIDLLNFTVDSCIPAGYDICQALEGGQHFVRLQDVAAEVVLPKTKISPYERKDKPLCPKPSPIFVNETDNSLLCRRVQYSDRNFPLDKTEGEGETIPIFWSGSSSFETFLQADFYDDHFVVNAMAATDDGASKYSTVNTIPNARIPFHLESDLEEVVIMV